jgi:hypothetical protein
VTSNARALVVVMLILGVSPRAKAQEGQADQRTGSDQSGAHGAAPEPSGSEELAKQLSNPIADLASIPFQFNWNGGVGPDHSLQLVLNIQPVVPVSLSIRWNLVGRFILPMVSQPAATPGDQPAFGFGDVVMSLFLSPNKQQGLVWGAGPVFGLPMGTDPRLGSGKWEVGPTAVVLWLGGPWTIGGLVNQLFSFAGVSDQPRDSVSQLFVQPFVAYSTPSAVTFTLMSETTINWKAASSQAATVPIEALVSKVTKLGPLPFSVQAGGGYFVDAPTGGPEWRARLTFVVLLPRKK